MLANTDAVKEVIKDVSVILEDKSAWKLSEIGVDRMIQSIEMRGTNCAIPSIINDIEL